MISGRNISDSGITPLFAIVLFLLTEYGFHTAFPANSFLDIPRDYAPGYVQAVVGTVVSRQAEQAARAQIFRQHHRTAGTGGTGGKADYVLNYDYFDLMNTLIIQNK